MVGSLQCLYLIAELWDVNRSLVNLYPYQIQYSSKSGHSQDIIYVRVRFIYFQAMDGLDESVCVCVNSSMCEKLSNYSRMAWSIPHPFTASKLSCYLNFPSNFNFLMRSLDKFIMEFLMKLLKYFILFGRWGYILMVQRDCFDGIFTNSEDIL